MNNRASTFDVVVVGAGPAGLAAAWAAAESGKCVAIIDDNPAPGGQIWRGAKPNDSLSKRWLRKCQRAEIEILPETRVIAADTARRQITIEKVAGGSRIAFRSLVLATGARERFLPFPGWTLPNVMGAGALQAFVKSGLSIRNKRVVVAGTGPLLVAVAAYLKKNGADIAAVIEQASTSSIAHFALGLSRTPQKVWQAARLRSTLWKVPYRAGCRVTAATGDGKVSEVQFQTKRRSYRKKCDYLAIGYGLVPNTELAAALGCSVSREGVRVDERQQTSIPGIFCAGEATGIGGVNLSLIEGQIAGCSAAGRTSAARDLFALRRAEQGFAFRLAAAFALRPELKGLPAADTIICRCEDVPYSALENMSDWRTAKLLTRCGMGPCQGRVCGAATEFLFGWQAESIRPPVFPARIETLLC
ncbi:MAG: FAD/NAD(P)-binding oxidoreductase [Bryobacteraceae bacterium]